MRHLASLRIMVSAEQDQRARRVIGLAMFKIAPAFGQRQNSRDIPPGPEIPEVLIISLRPQPLDRVFVADRDNFLEAARQGLCLDTVRPQC